MFPLNLKVGPHSDAVREARRISEQLQSLGLPRLVAESAAAQAEILLVPMIEAAKIAILSKARVHLTQSVTGPGYLINLEVDEGRPPSFMEKLRAAVGLG